MNGLLYIDKQAGWTSFDVVAKIRGKIRAIVHSGHEKRGYCHIEERGSRLRHEDDTANGEQGRHRCRCKVKVGHTGTLDPAATGLLIICVGKYTKKVPELIKQDKTYEVEMILGKESTTADSEGEIADSHLGNSYKQPDSNEINAALKKFVGTIQQTPPIFSAIKIDGKRAYDLARQGKEVKLEPRTVHIRSITDASYQYPIVRFVTRVGSGTYIRSLAVDIGLELRTGAYMSALKRTSIGDVTIDEAVDITDITEEYLQRSLQRQPL